MGILAIFVMILVDAHAHLDHHDFDKDLAEVIERAKAAGIKAIVSNGVNPETNRKTLEIAKRFDIVKPALGIYPPNALDREIKDNTYPLKPNVFDVDAEIEFIRKNKDKIIAIGEVGLDYESGKPDDDQEDVFELMIDLANEINKPLIVHSRKAEAAVLDTLETNHAKKVLLHCFCGKKSLIKRAVDLGYYFSIPTNIVRAHNFQNMVKIVDISRILTETDAPYLSPFQGKRNEPAFIIETIKKIAEIKGMNKEEVAQNIYMNFQKLF